MNIALLAGGDSSEREVSLRSAALMEAAFDRGKYDVFTVDVRGREWRCTGCEGAPLVDRNDFSTVTGGRKVRFDYAFIVIHGTPGEDGMMQGYLDIMGIPYSSCGLASAVVTFDKILCKRTVSGIGGLNLAREILIRKGEEYSAYEIAGRLGLPLFVKPNASGSSCGVTKVGRIEEIVPAVERAFGESDSVLVEEFVAGREFGCGVIITKDREYLLPVTEIISKNEFFDYEAKYTAGRSDEITPAEISPELAAEIQRLAGEAYRACGCRGLVRVDFIVTPDNRAYMIEINSVPGMSAGSIVPKQLEAAGMTMTEMIDIIIKDTFDY